MATTEMGRWPSSPLFFLWEGRARAETNGRGHLSALSESLGVLLHRLRLESVIDLCVTAVASCPSINRGEAVKGGETEPLGVFFSKGQGSPFIKAGLL